MGVGHLITARRIENFPGWETIQVMPPYEVIRDILRPAVEAKEKILGEGNEYAALPVEQRTKRLEDLISWVEVRCEEHCNPPAWRQQEEERHREAVLANEEEPTPADQKWLADYLQEQRDKSTNIEHLLTAAREG
jgi:hypothetical protein